MEPLGAILMIAAVAFALGAAAMMALDVGLG